MNNTYINIDKPAKLLVKNKVLNIIQENKQIGDIKTFIGLSASKPIEALPQFIFV